MRPYEFDGKLLVAGLAPQLEAAHVEGPCALVFWRGGPAEPEMRLAGAIRPTVEQGLYAKRLCRMLNAEMHMHGMWLVVWSEPEPRTKVPHRLVALFKDADGDINFSLDSEDPYERMLVEPVENWGQDAARAVLQHTDMMRKMDITQREQIKQALGEPSADPTAAAPVT